MRRLALALLATAAFTQVASAADLPAKAYTKAPAMVAVAPFSWSGCYLGVQVGYAWARDSDSERVTATGAASVFSPPNSASVSGGKIGGYLGCNLQTSAFVFGLEGDGDWANLKGSAAYNTPPPSDFYETTIKSQGSVRGRLGYAVDRALFYVTGGVAFAKINEHDQAGVGVAFVNNSTTRSGWTVGGGVDYAFTNNWIGRAEYRYANFGTFSYVPTIFPAFTENHKITESAVRLGLAYKF
jgi:outer membrane immunogenic protein